ncbi:unnamed protein product [Thlaspi arvense]|uniref:RING-type domain-containing protein n=1 Tax=Thlaspi arvense TaxID=13288 RepID=A0AAU9SDW8_THLAR|nr:unnamed protein product [Thlaspi arvense]
MATGSVTANFDANMFFDFDQTKSHHHPSRLISVCINLFHESDGTVSQIRLEGLKSHEFSPNHLFTLIDPRLDNHLLSDNIAETIANQALLEDEGFLQPNFMSSNFLLPKDKFEEKETQKEEEEGEPTCAICFGDLRDEEDNETKRVSLNCSHQFHIGCIGEWLVRRKSCPLCRGVVCKEL